MSVDLMANHKRASSGKQGLGNKSNSRSTITNSINFKAKEIKRIEGDLSESFKKPLQNYQNYHKSPGKENSSPFNYINLSVLKNKNSQIQGAKNSKKNVGYQSNISQSQIQSNNNSRSITPNKNDFLKIGKSADLSSSISRPKSGNLKSSEKLQVNKNNLFSTNLNNVLKTKQKSNNSLLNLTHRSNSGIKRLDASPKSNISDYSKKLQINSFNNHSNFNLTKNKSLSPFMQSKKLSVISTGNYKKIDNKTKLKTNNTNEKFSSVMQKKIITGSLANASQSTFDISTNNTNISKIDISSNPNNISSVEKKVDKENMLKLAIKYNEGNQNNKKDLKQEKEEIKINSTNIISSKKKEEPKVDVNFREITTSPLLAVRIFK
jgi:hypothetical protein